MSLLKTSVVDKLPPLVRGGAAKNLEENNQIKELLGQIGIKHKVEEVPSKQQYNSLQQRIRTAANRLGLKVSIQWSESENALYFTSKSEVTPEVVVEPEVKETKVSSKK